MVYLPCWSLLSGSGVSLASRRMQMCMCCFLSPNRCLSMRRVHCAVRGNIWAPIGNTVIPSSVQTRIACSCESERHSPDWPICSCSTHSCSAAWRDGRHFKFGCVPAADGLHSSARRGDA
ncbi:hypothetical protein FN846DRAFT_365269 [Sphaerosporella brunnea]|uniref:Uncharacterized protein n=1 Tax=Sphaerosporella brunnea TaxID=1250544 RepID=A0A5J5EJ50_9PEZI|nr:hypothetical protein FN846DRAFT_365269 [Sphaerosporella brunnea]